MSRRATLASMITVLCLGAFGAASGAVYTVSAHNADANTQEVDGLPHDGFTGIANVAPKDPNSSSNWIGRGVTVNSDPQTRAFVMPFLLPTLGPNEVLTDVTFQARMTGKSSLFNTDLYGLDRIDATTPTVILADHYLGPLDAANTRVVDNFATNATATGTVARSSAALLDFARDQIAAGAEGKYIFMRLSPDVAGNDIAATTARYTFLTANHGTAAYRPQLSLSTAPYGVIGYWRMEEGPDGALIGTTANSFGPGPDGTGKNGALYDDAPPTGILGNGGTAIYDPLTGAVLPNRYSLQGDTDAAYEHVSVPNPGRQDSFALEAFIRIDQEHDSAEENENANIGARFTSTGGDNRGYLWRYRVDNNDVQVTFYGEGDGNASALSLAGGAGILSDGEWHHVALAHDDTLAAGLADTFMYVDYAMVASGEFPANAVFFNKDVPLLFGVTNARSTALHMDEVRYHTLARGPDAFLRVTPEPATLTLLALGSLGLLARRRRKR